MTVASSRPGSRERAAAAHRCRSSAPAECRARSRWCLLSLGPLTSAIMRSRNVSPGLAVCARYQSDSTRVPPVTLLRSPPLSRMTGRSPVTALSSTEATPSITSPSPDHIAGLDQHDVVLAQSRARRTSTAGIRTGLRRASSPYVAARLRSASAWALPRPSAIASAKLANNTVNHSQAEMPKMNAGDSVRRWTTASTQERSSARCRRTR